MQLIVKASPHQKLATNTPWVMRQVMCALAPAVIASVWLFRERAVFLILNCMLTSYLTEIVIFRIRKKTRASSSLFGGDGSALLTGLLLALVLPPAMRWYAASIGSVFAVLVSKELFGGLGQNIFNPALMGRAFLMAAYPTMLTTWTNPFTLDAVTRATPLALRKFDHVITPLRDLFLGTVSGSLGETSGICLLLGGIYLLIRNIADWRIPLSMFLSTLVVSSFFYFMDPSWGSPLFHIFSGGFLLGAFFMATDPVTTPMSKVGRYIFGGGCGILILVIRYFSGYPEGVMFSILFMNALVPLIDRYTVPKPFGYEK